MPVGSSKIINRFAKASFTVYILHIMFLKYIRIPEFCSNNALIMIIHIVISAIIIYGICWIIYECYHFAKRWLLKLLNKVMSFRTISIDD